MFTYGPGTLLPVANIGQRGVLKIDPTLERQQFKLKTTGGTLAISGGSDLAVLYGAYAFAEKLGVRFYLHGDVVPDGQVPFAIPDLDETGAPVFETRGILPFHDFPEGPDLWAADDYKAVLAQMVKLRMNFIGLHTYTECGWGSEPTAWLGLPEDVEETWAIRASATRRITSTRRGMPRGTQPRRVEDMLFGGSLLFESDPWGPPVMRGCDAAGEDPGGEERRCSSAPAQCCATCSPMRIGSA